MHAYLEQEVLSFPLLIESAHGISHLKCCGQGSIGRGERCHDCIADGFNHCAAFGGDNAIEDAEMCLHQIECRQIAYPFVELGRPTQIGKHESQTGDLQALINAQGICAVDVTESLVGQQAFCTEKWPICLYKPQ